MNTEIKCSNDDDKIIISSCVLSIKVRAFFRENMKKMIIKMH